ncbi:TlpA disulfide reductase family protein [Nocardioides pocheonensis]|uniref:TlpA family protein disulfide reductase n=1 Tax=Nocardioides pocheonensis TaxID=661485 RepID=A0A3N0GW71_9ACTN|nr:TlpA disulfide reductase family protein [Nocardioides pocheonensis]RNM16687.1 TlpA family protein disulfide reductase [Nocardioides pocheonensis]
MPAALRSLLVVAVVSAALLGASGCSKVGSTGDKGYIAGAGVITLLPEAQRKAPGEVSGQTLDGDQLSLASYAGKVVVVNVWGAWCPPCRAEADDLAAAARELAPKGVVFVGINTRDASQDNARSFERRYDVPYPSIYDPGGRNLLAFHRTLTPNAIPSTVVIDAQGRVAASILGEVTSKTTLVDLVQDVIS